jgi:hypothetical protein
LWKNERILLGSRCKESIDDFTLFLKPSRQVIEVRPTVSDLRCFTRVRRGFGPANMAEDKTAAACRRDRRRTPWFSWQHGRGPTFGSAASSPEYASFRIDGPSAASPSPEARSPISCATGSISGRSSSRARPVRPSIHRSSIVGASEPTAARLVGPRYFSIPVRGSAERSIVSSGHGVGAPVPSPWPASRDSTGFGSSIRQRRKSSSCTAPGW